MRVSDAPTTRRAAVAFLWGVPIAALGGVIGLGGAEFRLPVLVGVLRHTARAAVPLNLAVSLVTICASLVSRSATLPSVVPYGTDLVALALGAIVAAFFGATWARAIPESQLRRVILVLLVSIGVALIVEALVVVGGDGLLPADGGVRVAAGLAFGLAIGVFSSVLGVAGGEVIIPTLVFAYGADIRTAGTASLLVSLPTVITGIARYAARGAYADTHGVKWTVLPMAIGSVIGATLGGLAVGLISVTLLKVGLGVILIWSALRIFRGSH